MVVLDALQPFVFVINDETDVFRHTKIKHTYFFELNNHVIKRTNTFEVVPRSETDEAILRRVLDASAALWNQLNYEWRQNLTDPDIDKSVGGDGRLPQQYNCNRTQYRRYR